ncbi:hypothetical protein [Micromonospora sp. WMMD812]|uniref:hypothetical protein n=1 Tax=Micromonospora sp. WMMD812 TaxID=3015152 RepID=UPI00248AEED7|nr:hypothetical protein [Micromonospora sp. WMMD812]WBB68828.1 hypothetical protein O7603_05535 [Micromonospora sp. WMMD812]
MRRWMAPALLVPLLSLLAACTPADEPVVALAVQDGEPVGVLVTCDGAFSQLSVYENAAEGDPTGRPLIRWGVNGTPTSEIVEVPLLGQPPQGWTIDETSRDIPASESEVPIRTEALTDLTAGVTYSLTGSSRRDAIPVRFTIADFTRIGTDQVLAPVNHEKTTVVSRDAFVRASRKTCG